jgi:hypothetical protein
MYRLRADFYLLAVGHPSSAWRSLEHIQLQLSAYVCNILATEDLSVSKHFNYVQDQSKYKGVWNEHDKQTVGHKWNSHGTDFSWIVSRFLKKRVTYEFLWNGIHTNGQNGIRSFVDRYVSAVISLITASRFRWFSVALLVYYGLSYHFHVFLLRKSRLTGIA